MTAPLYLGVDGGGTKTAFALIDATGSVLGREVLGGSYFAGDANRVAALHELLADGFDRVMRHAGRAAPAAAFLGLPGFGESPDDTRLIEAMVAGLLPDVEFWCDNDMVTAWAGAFAGGDGIAVIGGTGAMSYGRRGGDTVRVGGWGEIFGDEGSGYWIAVHGLNAWSRMSDGRQPAGPLLALLRTHLDLMDDVELIDVVHNRWRERRADIAALAPTIAAAADAGDDACRAILQRAGAELALLATTARRQLNAPASRQIPVSYVGGVFASPAVRQAFSAELDSAGGFDQQPPRLRPDLGAAFHAADLSGRPLSRAALDRLQDSIIGREGHGAPPGR